MMVVSKKFLSSSLRAVSLFALSAILLESTFLNPSQAMDSSSDSGWLEYDKGNGKKRKFPSEEGLRPNQPLLKRQKIGMEQQTTTTTTTSSSSSSSSSSDAFESGEMEDEDPSTSSAASISTTVPSEGIAMQPQLLNNPIFVDDLPDESSSMKSTPRKKKRRVEDKEWAEMAYLHFVSAKSFSYISNLYDVREPRIRNNLLYKMDSTEIIKSLTKEQVQQLENKMIEEERKRNQESMNTRGEKKKPLEIGNLDEDLKKKIRACFEQGKNYNDIRKEFAAELGVGHKKRFTLYARVAKTEIKEEAEKRTKKNKIFSLVLSQKYTDEEIQERLNCSLDEVKKVREELSKGEFPQND